MFQSSPKFKKVDLDSLKKLANLNVNTTIIEKEINGVTINEETINIVENNTVTKRVITLDENFVENEYEKDYSGEYIPWIT